MEQRGVLHGAPGLPIILGMGILLWLQHSVSIRIRRVTKAGEFWATDLFSKNPLKNEKTMRGVFGSPLLACRSGSNKSINYSKT